ncbi:MAG: carboxypeptidase regulatory-like domain-containing protein [Candidatus Aminicenantes bacterium]|nr:carboxypeptidase regulatory-like domain-containing protein [Candidatus Aminicenantes bacterium]
MKSNKIFALIVLFFFVITISPILSQVDESKLGTIAGFVYGRDLKTPVKDVQIVLTEVKLKKDESSPRVYQSEVTNKKGDYKIAAIIPGNYKVTLRLRNNLYKIKKIDFLVTIMEGKTSYISYSLRRKSIPPIAWIITGTAICKTLDSTFFEEDPASPTTR